MHHTSIHFFFFTSSRVKWVFTFTRDSIINHASGDSNTPCCPLWELCFINIICEATCSWNKIISWPHDIAYKFVKLFYVFWVGVHLSHFISTASLASTFLTRWSLLLLSLTTLTHSSLVHSSLASLISLSTSLLFLSLLLSLPTTSLQISLQYSMIPLF